MNMREIDALKETKEYKTASMVEDAINNMGWNPDNFAKAFTTWHRTLQQKFFRTIVATIREAASEEYGYDGRNEATHELAKEIMETGIINKVYLPSI